MQRFSGTYTKHKELVRSKKPSRHCLQNSGQRNLLRRPFADARGNFPHLGVHSRIRREQLPIAQLIRLAVKARHHASSLAHQQNPRGRIPGVQPELPEAVEASAATAARSIAAEPSRRTPCERSVKSQ